MVALAERRAPCPTLLTPPVKPVLGPARPLVPARPARWPIEKHLCSYPAPGPACPLVPVRPVTRAALGDAAAHTAASPRATAAAAPAGPSRAKKASHLPRPPQRAAAAKRVGTAA
jgi:hypothetical protein